MANSSFSKRTWAVGLVSLVIIVPLAVFSYLYFFSPVTTIVIVRHAEKAAEPADNPGLTPEGQARAQLLVHVLEGAGVKAVYASQYARTQLTMQPLAERLGLQVTVVNADDIKGLVRRILSEHPGEVVAVASHNNRVGPIIEALGGEPIGPITEAQYDRMFVVTVYRWRKAKVVMMKYGNPTP